MCDLPKPRKEGRPRDWLNDDDPWLVGLDVSIAEGEDVADRPRPHQFTEPGRVMCIFKGTVTLQHLSQDHFPNFN